MFCTKLREFYREFYKDATGGVSIIGAVAVCLLTSAVALSLNLSSLYVAKLRGQRALDLGIQAASITANHVSGSAPSAAAQSIAQNVVQLNGYGGSALGLYLNNNNRLDGSLLTTANLVLGRILSSATTAQVSNNASVTLSPQVVGCVIGLTGAVTIGASANLSSSNCGVIGSGGIWLNGAYTSLNMTGAAVGISQSAETAMVNPQAQVSPALSDFKYNKSVSNTLSSQASIVAITNKLNSMSAWPYVTAPPKGLSNVSVPSGPALSYAGQTVTIPQGNYGTLSITATSNLTFSGSGTADPNCTNPTSLYGATTISSDATLTFNSGCYVFNGDVTLLTAYTVTFAIVPNAVVKFVFNGAITNTMWGTMKFPPATYSIAKLVSNKQGGNVTFGDGEKVFGAGIDNGHSSSMALGNGPFYILGGTISQLIATFQFGNGPFYIWNSTITNGSAGTMTFGTGPFYIYNSTINSGNSDGGYPLTTFAAGPFYLNRSTFNMQTNAATLIGSGDMEFYNSNLNVYGATNVFGWNGSSTTGSSTVYLAGGALTHSAGSLTATGVTFAQSSGTMSFSDGTTMKTSLASATIVSPSAASPAFGYTDIALFNLNGPIAYNLSTYSPVSGMIYAPSDAVSIGDAAIVHPSNGRCLQIIGTTVTLGNGSDVTPSLCSGLTINTAYSGGKLTQ